MRDFNYEQSWKKLLTPEIVALLTQINEYIKTLMDKLDLKPVEP